MRAGVSKRNSELRILNMRETEFTEKKFRTAKYAKAIEPQRRQGIFSRERTGMWFVNGKPWNISFFHINLNLTVGRIGLCRSAT